MKKLLIEIAPDGSVSIDAVGFQGTECLAATKAIEDALGKVEDRTKKSEIYQPTVGVSQGVKK